MYNRTNKNARPLKQARSGRQMKSIRGQFAGDVAARLDRLPLTRGLWRLVLLISLGGAFEFYDLFMTAYVAPGLVAGGLFTAHAAGFFAPAGIGFFVFCTFAGMWLGSSGLRVHRRPAGAPRPSSPFAGLVLAGDGR